MTNFSKIACHYEKSSIVQKSASDDLFDLLKINMVDDVLDLGCGTGHLTKKIREITRGKVVGIDSAQGMIEKAKQNYSQLNISFEVCSADSFNFIEQFDVIFCNSTFQWFKNPMPILKNCYRALRKNGRIGIQAPARHIYSPNFIEAVKCVEVDRRTMGTFAHFNSPWFFLETPDEYKALFQDIGFDILHSRIDEIITSHTPDEVFSIFDSGASVGYLNHEYYKVPISDDYIKNFKEIVKDSFVKQCNKEEKVDLSFYRIYLLAIKKV